MLFKSSTLDDALSDILRRLAKHGDPIRSSKGTAREFTGVLLKLSDPTALFSRTEGRGTLFSFVGKTLWYHSGSDRLDHIEYYIPAYRSFIGASRRAVRAPGAYGPRLFGGGESSQMAQLVRMLEHKLQKSDTRQAVAQIFKRSDLIPGNGDVPCTTTVQFLPRKGKLHTIATMRSNDAYRGFPGDVFAFTFIQELVARTLGLEVGSYSHFVGSLHLYESDKFSARDYLREGLQSPMSMPPMPKGDPWHSVAWLIEAEQAIRLGGQEPVADGIPGYWLDLARLLRIKVLHRNGDMRRLAEEKAKMESPVYDAFIRGRQIAAHRRLESQPDLPGMLAPTGRS
ncbi:thymidylate synthase [uncultured Enterovirga sp.]|uniref:thymidylate synthase n=1 Tax=uncultured Enterovirga sp. TaxID=2026352 RepID=UPI0035CC7BFB